MRSQKEGLMSDIKRTVLEYVKKEYLDEDDDRDLTETTPLVSSGIVDSFSMVSLKCFLEKTYRIQIPDTEASADAFDSVTNIAALVELKMKNRLSPASSPPRDRSRDE